MESHSGAGVSDAIENASNYASSAVKNVTTLCKNAAGAVEREVHSLVRTVRERANDDAGGGLKSAIVAKCKQVPSGVWFLLSLGMVGILLASGGEKKKKRGSRHPSLCHCVQLQPSPFHCVQPFKRQTFCAQDIFDVESTITCFGSPHWEKTHEAATKTACVLETLKKNGAHFIGKTVMDELGFSLIGKNRWLEIPKNPSASYLICGGSSSGGAIAAASDFVDFALGELTPPSAQCGSSGIDTVGDTRVPAACCGVLGFRASHGIISMVGIIPVASSCDAVGWFARDAGMLLLVGRQLCTTHSETGDSGPKRFYVAQDVFKLSSIPLSRTADILSRSVQRTVGRLSLQDTDLLRYLEDSIPAIQTFKKELDRMSIESSQYTALDVLRESMLLFHRYEFKSNHGEWIAKVKPTLTTTVEAQVQKAVFSPSSEALRLIAVKVREELRAVVDSLLKDDAVLVLPTLPSLPPKVTAAADELELFEYRTHALMSLATISGSCQAVIPVGSNGSPMSVSLLARKGADLLLLNTVFLLHTTIQQEVLLNNDPNLPISRFLEIR